MKVTRKRSWCGWRFVIGLVCVLLATSGKSEEEFGPAVIEGKEGWLYPGWESLTNANSSGIGRCVTLIGEVGKLLAARNIGLIVLIVPMKASFYPKYLPEDRSISRDVAARYDQIISEMNLAGIIAPNVRPIFFQVESEQHTAFFKTDYHWTAWAAEATALLIAKEIQGRWKLRGKAQTGAPLGPWTSEMRYGDLTNFLSNDRRRQIGEELFMIRRNVAHGGLLDNNSNPVQVIGNSFMQPYLGFSQRLSHELDRLVGLTWNYGNVGPWATFLQSIQSADFKKGSPQVVVWQFNEGQFMNGPNAPGQWDRPSNLMPDIWLERVKTALAN